MLNKTSDEKERLVRDDVREYGWSFIYVIDDEGNELPFGYSVGLFESYGHPEIIIVGFTEALANPVVDSMGCGIAEEGKRYEAGRYYDDILQRVDCYMHRVRKDCYADYVGWDLWYYRGDDFPLLQCVYPCDKGLFPWDPAASRTLIENQPIIGGLQGH